jgi:hypothetical protein
MLTSLIPIEALHVLAGVFWAGTTFALARLGVERAGQLLRPQLGAAVVAVATGALLWFLFHRGDTSMQAHILALGATFAVLALGVQAVTAASGARKLSTSGGPDALQVHNSATIAQRMAAPLLAVTVVCMAIARYL